MRNELVEVGFNRTNKSRGTHSRRALATGDQALGDWNPRAFDEAFAAGADGALRVDDLSPDAATADGHQHVMRRNESLVSTIVSQLVALDRQRDRLANLLAGIESDASPSDPSQATAD